MNDGTVNKSRRRFLIGSTSLVSAAGAVGAAVPFVGSWQPSAKALAAGAPITIDIGRLNPGELLGPMPAWRGQPIFVMRRDETTLESLRSNLDHLADPQSENANQQPAYAQNEFRSRKPELMILVGICTHLGCSPQLFAQVQPQDFDPEWKGGFFCPCHGSMFDLAGRVFRGVPAPSNLRVPPHYYVNDNVIVIGLDAENS
ncbi:MAG: ubiquinol-cytochrome c reductase iron-sulfur subunit [Pseudomonadales bacterium]|nr:ubiquinol-cytochrome c reductase iron-sulfur subunit [Pseudomonadales bacterium]